MTSSNAGRRSIIDMSDFSSGWGSWIFSEYLLGGGAAKANLISGEGLFSSCVVQFDVAGANDGGFVFIKRRILADDGAVIQNALTSWWITEPQPPGVPWSRMVYAGAPKAFDNPESLAAFDVLEGQTDVILGTELPNGVGLQYGADFDAGFPEIQICLGWRIPPGGQGTSAIAAILIEAEQDRRPND